MSHTNQEKQSPDLIIALQNHANTNPKNAYIGLTLMQYFKLSNSKQGLQEIDEESNSSLSHSGTPCFADFRDRIANRKSSKMARKQKVRTETYDELTSLANQNYSQPLHKISTLNLDDLGIFDKNAVKLPSIHDQRHTNNSRQGMMKEGKVANKKQHGKSSKNQQNSSLTKNGEKNRQNEMNRNGLMLKKSIRARVTSTSFYHMNAKDKERDRIKTEEEMPEKNLEKSFVITKYGGNSYANSKKHKQQPHLQTIKKYENTFKMLKNIIN